MIPPYLLLLSLSTNSSFSHLAVALCHTSPATSIPIYAFSSSTSFSPLSLSLSCVLAWTCSHCFSIDWRLPLEHGTACVWSNGTEICSHFSSHPWWDFLQNVSAPDVEFSLWNPTAICLLSIRNRTHDISFNWLSASVCTCLEGVLQSVWKCV